MKLAVICSAIYPKHLIVFGLKAFTHKLKGYGISVDLLKWFGNYLNERKQKVFVNGVLSYEAILNDGVSLGSGLGPLLLLLFINDIADDLYFLQTTLL